jgi:hypothetical protein
MDGPTEKARDLHTPIRGTLRDTFAAAALTGILAGQREAWDIPTYTAHAYEFADAMLEASSSDRSGRSD